MKYFICLVLIIIVSCSNKTEYCSILEVTYSSGKVDTLTVIYDMDEYDKKPYLRLYNNECQTCIGYSTAPGTKETYVACGIHHFNVIDSCKSKENI